MTLPRFERLRAETPGPPVTIVGTVGLTLLVLICWLGAVAGGTFIQYWLADLDANSQFELTARNEMLMAGLMLVGGFGTGLLAVLLVRKVLERRPMRGLMTGHPRFRWTMMLAAFALVAGITLTVSLFTEADMRATLNDRLTAYGGIGFALVTLAYLVGFAIQGTFEEVFLRGWMTQRLCAHGWSVWVSALASTAIFVGLHIAPGIGPTYLALVAAMGLAFAWSAIRLNGLEFAIGAHVANNFVVGGLFAGLISGQGYAEQDGAWISLVLYLLVFGGVVEVFARLSPRFWPDRSDGARNGPAGLPRLSLRA
jgi:uncharacterized protein